MQMDGQTDRRADMMKLIVTFCRFVNVPKSQYVGVETCNTTLNFIENPVCGIEERASGEEKKGKEKRRKKKKKDRKNSSSVSIWK
jgi:hypothetical protein